MQIRKLLNSNETSFQRSFASDHNNSLKLLLQFFLKGQLEKTIKSEIFTSCHVDKANTTTSNSRAIMLSEPSK